MLACFASDLHGKRTRYEALFQYIADQRPQLVLLGGDLFPHELARQDPSERDFIRDYLHRKLRDLRQRLAPSWPRILLILGNDDARAEEATMLEFQEEGLVEYIHMRTVPIGEITVTGYAFVPPTPFLRKDWEKYDVSRFVDPGSVPPTEGYRTIDPDYDPAYDTIQEDLDRLLEDVRMDQAILLFHSPPYQTQLDRAALDGRMVDHVPLDVHVGSIAIRRMIERKAPRITLHGHVHETSSLTGTWQDRIGPTFMFSAAWDGPELALVVFDPARPDQAQRLLLD